MRFVKETILTLSLAVLLSACATTNTANTARLECPPKLVLPKLTEEQDLAFFEWNVTVYTVIAKRDELYEQRIEMMCRIIESTHQE